MSEEIKVLMVGGRRCGKTSALASVFQQITNDDGISKYLTISDATVPEVKNGEQKEGLNDKILELKMLLQKPSSSSIFLVDKHPTNTFWDYKLRVGVPGKSESICINFRDSAGEFFVKQNKMSEITDAYMKDCDIFVVVVDTPYLMEANEVVCDSVNRIDDITNFFKNNVSTKSGEDPKEVIFVPIKCEKWYNEGKINLVVEKVEQAYGGLIKHLRDERNKNMVVGILPILTVGNIEFVEQKEAYIYRDGATGKNTRCCKLGTKTVRLEDGKLVQISEKDEVVEDANATLYNITRPYSWFRVTNNSYNPSNCDQLPLRIVAFVLKKYKLLKEQQANLKWWKNTVFIKALIMRYNKYLGMVDPEELQDILSKIRNDKIWKERGTDGIKFY